LYPTPDIFHSNFSCSSWFQSNSTQLDVENTTLCVLFIGSLLCELVQLTMRIGSDTWATSWTIMHTIAMRMNRCHVKPIHTGASN